MRRSLLPLFLIPLALLSGLASADESRWDALRVYRLADGRGVAVAYPGEWIEVSKTRVLDPGAPVQFVNQAGHRIEIPAVVLERAARTKSVARPLEYPEVALRSR